MRIGRLRTFWIIFQSSVTTAIASLRSILKAYFSTPDRQWVDQTISSWINKLLDQAGISCKVINPHQVEPQKGQATIIMCNHASLYDIPISYKAFPHHSVRMLAKKELSKIPFLGRGMKAAEFPFVDRKNRHQAIRDLAYAKELMNSGIVIWLAPEGTRSKDGKLGKFKKGGFITAIQAKATIIPMGIRGAYDILPKKTYQLNINQTAEIHIGQPIDASAYSLESKNELLDKVYQEMKRLVGEEEETDSPILENQHINA